MAKSKIRLNVTGMSCDHCVKSVQEALEAVDGVLKTKVNLKRARADVQYDPELVTTDVLVSVVQDAGYEASAN